MTFRPRVTGIRSPTFGSGERERKFRGARVPGAKVPGNDGMELPLPGVKVLRSESSIIRSKLAFDYGNEI